METYMAKDYYCAYNNVVKDYEQIKTHFKSIVGADLKFKFPIKEKIQDIEDLWNSVKDILPILEQGRSEVSAINHNLCDVALIEISRLQQNLDCHLTELFESLTDKGNFERLKSKIDKEPDLVNPLLIYACESGMTDLIKDLIKNPKVDLSFTSPYGVTSLDALCSSEDQFEQSTLLEIMDLLFNKAREQKVLDKLLITKSNTDTTALFGAILNPDIDTAEKMVDKLLAAASECKINLFLCGQSPLIAALKRDDNVEEMLQHLFDKDLLKYNHEIKTIQEALEFCATENKFDYAKVIIDNAQEVILQSIYHHNKTIITSPQNIGYNTKHYGFVVDYEEYLKKALGNDSLFVEEEY